MSNNLPDAIRAAVNESGIGLTELAEASGVDRSQLHRFTRGERSLTLDTADQVLVALGLVVHLEASKPKRVPAHKPKRKGK
jgi:plasmid maintenance system antidote protein VapI